MSEKYSADHWGHAPAIYDAHTLKIADRDVMEDWEQGYMEHLASIATANGGAVLELGYGMGISAAAIQAQDISSHTIIECHPDVVRRCVTDFKEAFIDSSMRLYTGFWQNVTPTLRSEIFDGILFDTYPIKEEEHIGPHMWFFEEAFRLLKPGGILTYYSDEATHFKPMHLDRLASAGFTEEGIGLELCEVSPPEGCEYWQEDTIVVPIVRKKS